MTNAAEARIDAKLAASFKAHGMGESGTFRRRNTAPALPCTILIDENVQFVGDQTQVVDRKTLATTYYAEIGQPEPVRGDLFALGARSFIVDSILDQGESEVTCIVTEQA